MKLAKHQSAENPMTIVRSLGLKNTLGITPGEGRDQKSQRRDSNPGPVAYEATALPTELRWLAVLRIVNTQEKP